MQRLTKNLAAAVNKHQKHLYFLLGFFNFFAFIVFAVIHVGVYGTEFRWSEELYVLFRMALTASLMAIVVYATGIAVLCLRSAALQRRLVAMP